MIRLVAISSENMMARVLQHAASIADLRIIPHIYDNPAESASILDRLADFDVLFFAGPLPYLFAKDKIAEHHLPAVFVEDFEHKLAISLLHIKMNEGWDLDELSIDLLDKRTVDQVTRELGQQNVKWFVKDYSEMLTGKSANLDMNEIIEFHEQLFASRRTRFALTSIDFVYKRLQQLGVPCHTMIVPDHTIHEAVERAAGLGRLMLSKNAQIAIGIVVANPYHSLLSTGYLNQDGIMGLHQTLLEIGKSAEASVHQLGMDQFIIYGTRKSMETIMEYFQSPALLEKMERLMHITVRAGFGFGLTAKSAEEHARIALYYATTNEGNHCAFLVTEQKEVVGPLTSKAKSYKLKSETEEVLDAADKAGLSVATINKLLQLLRLRGENRFTAKDIAEYLEVSRRSAERIMKKLLEQQLAEVIGEEQPHQQGRPRAIYRLTF